jgi:hypothetical protein
VLRAGGRLAAALALLASGCLHDGRYVVRGTVASRDGGERRPVGGATAAVSASDRRSGGSRAVLAGPDGRFEVEYWFGGMLPFTWGDGGPVLTVTAGGFAPASVPLDREKRRPCPGAPAPACFEIEVVLTASASAEILGNGHVCDEAHAESSARRGGEQAGVSLEGLESAVRGPFDWSSFEKEEPCFARTVGSALSLGEVLADKMFFFVTFRPKFDRSSGVIRFGGGYWSMVDSVSCRETVGAPEK